MEDFRFKIKKEERLFNEIISKYKFSFMQQKQIYLGILSRVKVILYALPDANKSLKYIAGTSYKKSGRKK